MCEEAFTNSYFQTKSSLPSPMQEKLSVYSEQKQKIKLHVSVTFDQT